MRERGKGTAGESPDHPAPTGDESQNAAAAAAGEVPSFSQAIAELEAILRRIEGEEIDIDDLARELSRASALLELARSKVRKAETEVTQIVQGLEEEAEKPYS
jgi:exodeoxyribonuclease VII small subunit